jgi:diguanylate cyclase (GGDEF)-like protein/PAS domain S-box-containing protein
MDSMLPALFLLALIALVAMVVPHRQLRSRLHRTEAALSVESERNNNYGLVLENFDDVAFLYDLAAKQISFVTPSVERQRGWKAAELVGKSLSDLLPSLDLENVKKLVTELKNQQMTEQSMLPVTRVELDVPLKNGGMVSVETEYKLIGDSNAKPLMVLGISRDCTDRLHYEKQLREAEERVRLALYCSGDGVWDMNLQAGAMNYAEGWEALLGYTKAEVDPTISGYTKMIHVEDAAKFKAELERHIQDEVPSFQCEFRVLTKGGGWRWLLSRGMIWSRSPGGKPLRMIGTHTDITSRKVAEVAMSRTNVKLHSQIDEIRLLQTKLAEQAVRDPLTGLYNRRYLDETLEREVARARREGHPLSVVMLDVDHFKRLNDSYGHQAGDEVLKALGDLLRDDTRAEDVACRYGGEEFLVLLPSMPLDKACERAERWRAQLEKHTFVFGNFPLSVTASFGVSSYPHHAKTPDDLTHAADSALYNAKHNGRNRVEVFEEAPIVFLTGNPAPTQA